MIDEDPATLPDYLAPGLRVVSVGLNPSLPSVRAGFYFANPRNRFWRALAASGLVPEPVEPGPAAMRRLLERHRIGFTDVVKRPTAGASDLRAADYRAGAARLRERLGVLAPGAVWLHGKVAARAYLRYAERRTGPLPWGAQAWRLAGARVFVTPNPSPANAAWSLDDLASWYRRLADWL